MSYTETWQERNARMVDNVRARLHDYAEVRAERDIAGRVTGNVLIPAEKLLAYLDAHGITPNLGCEECHGTRGGVPGNGNVVSGRILCDYCHADHIAPVRPS